MNSPASYIPEWREGTSSGPKSKSLLATIE